MRSMEFYQLLITLKKDRDVPHSILLGAGASIESGVQCADDCIWDWKKEIFLSQNSSMLEFYSNIKADIVRNHIQLWLDNQGIYPLKGGSDEYSYYAEKAYPIEENRRKYFKKLSEKAEPSLGYHLISFMSKQGFFKSVWTTNFDGLMEKSAHQYRLSPISITAETYTRIYRPENPDELLIIALHGDYKYGQLKNTCDELDSEDEKLVSALKHELTNRDLIVIGYSGRDHSLMEALEKVYSTKGAGKLFWCGYGNRCNSSVCKLLETAYQNGRDAYYISTNGFDETMYNIARHCYSDDEFCRQKITLIKSKLSNFSETISSDFTSYSVINPNKIVDTNLYPISLPKNCYQFEVDFGVMNNKIWDFCKNLYEKDIMAIPYKGIIYAWGDKCEIIDSCDKVLKGEITLSPLQKEDITKVTAFKELALKTITKLLAQYSQLKCFKNKIWDEKMSFKKIIGGKEIIAYMGVCLSIVNDINNIYISLIPAFYYKDKYDLSKEEKKEFSDYFNCLVNVKSPNSNVRKYISDWEGKLIGNRHINLKFPKDSLEANFEFKISHNSALLKLNSSYSNKSIKSFLVEPKRMVFNAFECSDPKLVFYDNKLNCLKEDFHPMRGLIHNAPIDSSINVAKLKSTILLGVICPNAHSQSLFNFLNNLNYRCDVKYNIDYVIPFPGFYNAFKTNLNIPRQNDKEWCDLSFDKINDRRQIAEFLTRKIDQLSSISIDVIVIYIPEEFESYTFYSDGNEKFDLHDYIKAYAAQKQIATQFIREKTIKSELLCQILWALSLAIYVKSGGTPWLISESQNDTAFAGIGYSVQNTSHGANVIIGCSHVYASNGQGLKYKLSKLNDVTFDKKNNPYLSESEAYKLGLNIKELFYKSFSEMPKRVVIHKRTPFKHDEIKGLTESLSSAGINDINLIEVSYEDSITCFAYNKDMTFIDGFPVKRGLCFPLNKNTMMLYTHGIAPSIKSDFRSYVQGGKTIPMPLKITSYFGKSSMKQIASEILGLTKMNWNSFGLYTKLPCTIESSNEIARIGWLLSKYDGMLYEYRFFM